MFVNAFSRKFSQHFVATLQKQPQNFINFIGIQKFCICAQKILKFANFYETIFAYLRTYVHLNPFRMRQHFTAILVLLKYVVLANPILRHMNKSYIQKQLCMDFRRFLRFFTLFTSSGYHASLLPLWQTFESNPCPGSSTR